MYYYISLIKLLVNTTGDLFCFTQILILNQMSFCHSFKFMVGWRPNWIKNSNRFNFVVGLLQLDGVGDVDGLKEEVG